MGILDITPLYGPAGRLDPAARNQLEELRRDIKAGKFTVQEVRKKSE